MVFIFDDNKNILLLKRTDNKKWEPVKGGVKIKEDWVAASSRELYEETGFSTKGKINLFKIVQDKIFTEDNVRINIKGYVSYYRIKGIKPVPLVTKKIEGEIEHEDYKWVDYSNIESINIFPPIANSLIHDVIKVACSLY